MNLTRWTTPVTAATMKRLASLSVVVALAVLGSACGDDDGTAPALAPDTLPRTDFVEQANALCAKSDAHVGQVISTLFAADRPAPADMQTALDDIVATTRTLAEDIDALPEPSAMSGEVTALVTALDAATDEAEAQGGPAFFADNADPWAAPAAIAGDLGLHACAAER